MKLNAAIAFSVLAIVAFAVVALAAPAAPVTPSTTFVYTSLTPNPASKAENIFARGGTNDCSESTFDNQTSESSPLVTDCLKIVSNIAGGGTWIVQPYAQHRLVQFGTCAFGVQTGLEGSWHAIKVGNADISDLINASIDKFQWYGKVGAKGDMPCQKVTTGNQRVRWGIYHT
ncbi:hypothetical protein H100_00636 [Trichophyton rubrum MR850]|nr:hypothetical protein H100_00636 [Trichophyton rubrum MR850]